MCSHFYALAFFPSFVSSARSLSLSLALCVRCFCVVRFWHWCQCLSLSLDCVMLSDSRQLLATIKLVKGNVASCSTARDDTSVKRFETKLERDERKLVQMNANWEPEYIYICAKERLKCVDALRLDIFMSYQSMFVAIILFSFLMSKQRNMSRMWNWRAWGAIDVWMVALFGLCAYILTQNTHTHSENWWLQLQRQKENEKNISERTRELWLSWDGKKWVALSLSFASISPITNSIYTWIWKFL